MLGGGKSGARVMQLVSAWLRSELSPSDSGASHPHSARSSQRAESLALTRRSLPSSPLPSVKQFAWAAPLQSAAFCAKGPQGSHMSSRCLWPLCGWRMGMEVKSRSGQRRPGRPRDEKRKDAKMSS